MQHSSSLAAKFPSWSQIPIDIKLDLLHWLPSGLLWRLRTLQREMNELVQDVLKTRIRSLSHNPASIKQIGNLFTDCNMGDVKLVALWREVSLAVIPPLIIGEVLQAFAEAQAEADRKVEGLDLQPVTNLTRRDHASFVVRPAKRTGTILNTLSLDAPTLREVIMNLTTGQDGIVFGWGLGALTSARIANYRMALKVLIVHINLSCSDLQVLMRDMFARWQRALRDYEILAQDSTWLELDKITLREEFSAISLSGCMEAYNDMKHVYRYGIIVNEDGYDYFEFTPEKSSNLLFTCFYLVDGHGEVKLTQASAKTWTKSPAERYVDHLRQCISRVVKALVNQVYESSQQDGANNSLCKGIAQSLCSIYVEINQDLLQVCPDLVRENGATLVLGFVIQEEGILLDDMLFASVGDSSMMLVDADKGIPLKVWKRDIDSLPATCSWEGKRNTLASFPFAVKEGQTLERLKEDFRSVGSFCRPNTNSKGEKGHSLFSPRSPYSLNMINTLGNMNHDGRLLSRTNVYRIPTSLTTEIPNLVAVFCSDGVKDQMQAENIAAFFTSIDQGLAHTGGIPREEAGFIDIDELFRKVRPVGVLEDASDERAAREITEAAQACDDDGINLPAICTALVHTAIARRSFDDCTVLAVNLSQRNSSRQSTYEASHLPSRINDKIEPVVVVVTSEETAIFGSTSTVQVQSETVTEVVPGSTTEQVLSSSIQYDIPEPVKAAEKAEAFSSWTQHDSVEPDTSQEKAEVLSSLTHSDVVGPDSSEEKAEVMSSLTHSDIVEPDRCKEKMSADLSLERKRMLDENDEQEIHAAGQQSPDSEANKKLKI
ncbi:hypothetical protein SmJEL517_g06011 [Synchytrium microbalum]|uniref:PPM-type phosphatase domain-containing protein n=1 Tax=Synchytrium microbalum TaxID=1806994 RepID=A0A507BYJ9_9FUNG|nr:uncharacterized protein SmJEL517_g06011 [Synchytrium microbalum]TPX30415.1 hypothetical protein SmJEL517_g06011 [Synchytrium microbalum]